jgi:uncharacterized protein YkwD
MLLLAMISSVACVVLAGPALAHRGGVRHRVKHVHIACQAKRKHRGKQAHRKCRRAHAQRASQRPMRLAHPKQTAQRPMRPAHPKQTATAVVRVASPAATIASVLASPCENTELMPAAGNIEQVDEATVCLINQERARNGELPLTVNGKLAQVAEGHSAEMVSQGYFAHVAPDGETPLERVQSAGYIPNSQVGYTLGENIAWGTLSLATPNAMVAAWIASPEHLANILNPAYTETGVGVAPAAPASLAEGQPGAVYAQEFGVIEG